MRALLITDTHGELEPIERLLEETGADCCIHCGDFGFYDAQSVERLSVRELRLRVKHSELPHHVRKQAWDMTPEELRAIIREHGLLDGIQPWLDGERRFKAPVYAVPGNHEDIAVVRELREGRRQVDNLHLLHEGAVVELDHGVRLLGLGGNMYHDEGSEGFSADMSGYGGVVRSSWVQLARLVRDELQRPEPRARLLVTHVSPGKLKLLERVALVLGARFAFCGHMDPPTCQAWSLFATHEPREALERSAGELRQLKRAWASADQGRLSDDDRAAVEGLLRRLDMPDLDPPERGKRAERGTPLHGYYNTQFVCLADAPEGWGLLDMGERGLTLRLEAKARW